MADAKGNIESKRFSEGIPQESAGFYVKGAGNCDWGMKNRLRRIFQPHSGKTLMLAFDHGYIMGPTSGLERLDLAIPPLEPYADVLMATRGALRSAIPASVSAAVALRCTAGSSVLREDMSAERVGVDIDDAIRLNAACMAVQLFIGTENECRTIRNLCEVVDAGNRYGIPTLGVVAVGKQMERTTKYFLLATRMIAEFGAQLVKTYYCDEFEKVTAACPVPIVIAGGKKLPEPQALQMARDAIDRGAAGVDMGRNVFQAQSPIAMMKALRAVVHDGASAKDAAALYEDERRKGDASV